MTISEDAVEANARGNALRDSDLAASEAAYRQALSIAPDYEHAWFNLAVVCKWQCRWKEAREAVERSLVLMPDDNPGSLWNLGIVATALEDWAAARSAWKRYGIEIPDGDGPLDMDLGPAPIRVNGTEVVWCQRVDPARAIIRSIPLPDSGRRHGDLILHDGEPKGSRTLGNRTLSVFNELAVLSPSDEATFQAAITAPSPEDVAELERCAEKAKVVFEDWTGSLQLLCKECSEGTPHRHEPGSSATEWKPERTCGFASRDEAVVGEVLREWARGRGFLARLFSTRKVGRCERVA